MSEAAGPKGTPWRQGGSERHVGNCPARFKEKVRSAVPRLLLGRVEIEMGSVF